MHAPRAFGLYLAARYRQHQRANRLVAIVLRVVCLAMHKPGSMEGEQQVAAVEKVKRHRGNPVRLEKAPRRHKPKRFHRDADRRPGRVGRRSGCEAHRQPTRQQRHGATQPAATRVLSLSQTQASHACYCAAWAAQVNMRQRPWLPHRRAPGQSGPRNPSRRVPDLCSPHLCSPHLSRQETGLTC